MNRSGLWMVILAALGLAGCSGSSGTFAGTRYSVVTLGAVGRANRIFGISSCNLAVGDQQQPDGTLRAVVWDPQTSAFSVLALLPGSDEMSASAANGAGTVVGFAAMSTGGSQGFTWRDTNANGVAEMSEYSLLPNLGGSSLVFDINEAGTVVGSTEVGAGGTTTPVAWFNGAVVQLAPGAEGTAYAINASGVSVGEVFAGSNKHATVFKNGTTIDLGTFGGNNSVARDINASGVVVGEAQNADGFWRAFRWTDKNGNNANDPGEMEDLGSIGGDNMYARSIADNGDIIGYGDSSVGGALHGFLYQSGKLTDINATIPQGTGVVVSKAFAVNASGQVVGTGFTNTNAASYMLVAGGSGTLNRCPVITQLTNTFVPAAHANTFVVTATDADGDTLTYKWTLNGPVTSCGSDAGSPSGANTRTYVHEGCTSAAEAASSVTIEVFDTHGGRVTYTHPLRSEGTFTNPR